MSESVLVDKLRHEMDYAEAHGFQRSTIWLSREDTDAICGALEARASADAENARLREAAEDVYGPWSCGEPLDREMRELGRALGMTIDPA